MKREYRKAYNALKKLNIAVSDKINWGDGVFEIYCEGNTPETKLHCDYYRNYFGSEALRKILKESGLYLEWENPGVASVYPD